MTDKNEIYNELQSIYAVLPAEEYPKMYDYITAMLADEECCRKCQAEVSAIESHLYEAGLCVAHRHDALERRQQRVRHVVGQPPQREQ